MRFLVILFSALFVVSCNFKSDGEKKLKKILTVVNTQKVSRSVQEARRKFSGNTYPWKAHGIGFLISGRVTSIRIQEGDFVKKGKLLATIAPEDYELVQKLALIQASTLKPNVNRVDSLVKKKVMPQSKLDEISGKYEAALTQQERAKRQVNYSRLIAPVSGIVHKIETAVGQVIGAGSPAVILLEMENIKVKFGVSQSDLRYFNDKTNYKIDFPGVAEGLKAELFNIDLVPDNFTKTYNVVFTVDNKEKALRAGMLAHLSVVIESKEGIFMPLRSLKKDNFGNTIVVTVDPQTAITKNTRVTTGALFGEMVEIKSGLVTGDNIIIKGHEFVNGGDKVLIK